jgi:hypothetical protein
MQMVRYGLLAGALIFGVLVSARAIFGPLDFPASVHTPINVESVCGLLLTAAFLLGTRPDVSVRASVPVKAWAWASFVLALIVAGFWRSVGIYFLADDFVLVTRANAFHLAKVPELLTTAEASAFFRPIIHLTMAVTAKWAHFDPRLWRANALALHALNSALVFGIAFRLGLSRSAALFAGGLFAIHGCLPESVVWIAGWFGTLSTFFVLCGLNCFVGYLTNDGGARGWWGMASIGAMMLALLSKETAYAFPLIAALLAWDRRKMRESMPVLYAFFAGALVLFAYRWWLLGGIGGYADLKSGGPLLMKLSILPVLRSLLLRLWAVLCFPINWSREPELWLGVLTAAYLAALIWVAASRRSGPSLLFPAGFVLLAALPPLEQLLIGPDLQKSRELYLPLAGFCLFLASAVDRLGERGRWIVPAIVLAFNFATLQHNVTIWQHVGATAERTCAAASRCSNTSKLSVRDLPGSIDGVYFLGVGFPECIGLQTHSAPPTVEVRDSGASDLTWEADSQMLRCDVGR